MQKLKLLWCSEASYLNTGYAVYSREVLSRLYASDKLDITEFASYGSNQDARAQNIPWKFIGNLPTMPRNQHEAEHREYESNPLNMFGLWKFESACLAVRPNIICSNTDYWMSDFHNYSPARPYYHRGWLVACDAYPQNRQWIDTYTKCDSVFTYSDWAIDVLNKQSNTQIPLVGSVPGGAPPEFRPIDKEAIKRVFGLQNHLIIGMVARNQKRKLFPDLFDSFRQFLDKTKRNDILLYCHTSYPDKNPWLIPELLNEYNIASKVLFTYKCNTEQSNQGGGCGLVFPAFFSDAAVICKRCGKAATTCSVQNGLDNETLNKVYNLFDLYVQYANSEGLGIPQIEAAACGLPIMAVDYSAMSDVSRKLKGVPLKVKALYKELETGCNRAVPDNEYFVEKLIEFINLPSALRIRKGWESRKAYEEHYGFDKAAKTYLDRFTSLDVRELESRWSRPAKIHRPAENPPNCSNSDFVRWLITDVLGEPDKLGSYLHSRLLRDLNYNSSVTQVGGFLSNQVAESIEQSIIDYSKQRPFGRQEAYNEMRHYCEKRNFFERKRCNI